MYSKNRKLKLAATKTINIFIYNQLWGQAQKFYNIIQIHHAMAFLHLTLFLNPTLGSDPKVGV